MARQRDACELYPPMLLSAPHMALNVDITQKKNENPVQMVRRFTRAFRDTGITYEIRGRRYFKRAASDLRRKNTKLRKISDSKKYTFMRKMGQM